MPEYSGIDRSTLEKSDMGYIAPKRKPDPVTDTEHDDELHRLHNYTEFELSRVDI